MFNDIALFPSLQNWDDFVAIADGGVRFAFTKTLFSEIRIDVNYDDSPAPAPNSRPPNISSDWASRSELMSGQATATC